MDYSQLIWICLGGMVVCSLLYVPLRGHLISVLFASGFYIFLSIIALLFISSHFRPSSMESEAGQRFEVYQSEYPNRVEIQAGEFIANSTASKGIIFVYHAPDEQCTVLNQSGTIRIDILKNNEIKTYFLDNGIYRVPDGTLFIEPDTPVQCVQG